MAILPKSGRVVISESILARPIHIAWGLGDGAWLTPPAEGPNATALQSEIGRRVATQTAFVAPDDDGTIVLPQGKFSLSVTPTNHLYVLARFDFSEEPSAIIREIGVFVGTVVNPALPPGQEYFTPAQVSNPGRMLYLQNSVPIYRSPALRESFEAVIAF